MNFNIFHLQTSQIDELHDVIENTVTECYNNIYAREVINYFLSYHNTEIITDDAINGTTVVLLNKDKIIGSGTLVGTNLRRLFVLPQYQKKGAGSIILDYLESIANSQNLDFTELYSMIPAADFYFKKGYKTIKTCEYKTDGDNYACYRRMIKLLKPKKNIVTWNFNDKTFKITNGYDNRKNLYNNTLCNFYQSDEFAMGTYSGGLIKDGELIGHIDNNIFKYSYEQTTISGFKESGYGSGTISFNSLNKLRIVNRSDFEATDNMMLFNFEEV